MITYELIPVSTDDSALQGVLTNLTKMYCFEWSQYTGMEVDEAGCYGFEKYLPSYWEKQERHAFLLRASECDSSHWAGFVLLDRDFFLHKDYDFAMAEFFVLHKYRRRGAGRFMANAMFSRFSGRWELGSNPHNITASAFWRAVIGEYTNGDYELVTSCREHVYIDGTFGDVFAFDTRRG